VAHNINDGRMFVNGKCWHNEGVRVDTNLTSAEAIVTAKLNVPVITKPVYAEVNGQFFPIEGKNCTMRQDNNAVLGVVGDRYKVLQNVEAFSFFDDVVKTGDAIYHSAGMLGKGERIWILAKLPKDLIVFRDDVVEKYLLLTNSHDGTSTIKMYFTPIRVVCQNTLNASLKNSKDGISIRHTTNMKFKIEEARKVLGLALDFYGDFEINAIKMTKKTLSENEISSYYDKVLKIDDMENASTRVLNQKEELISLQKNGKGNNIDGLKNTVWTAYNAVTEYIDHYRTVKGGDVNRINSVVFGSGAKMKETALEKALELVG